MNETRLKVIDYLLLCATILGTLGFIMYAAGGIGGALDVFTLWTILPPVMLLLVCNRSTSLRTLITVTTLSILCALSMYLYVDSLFIHPDAQGALIFFFLPLYQLVVILLGFVFSWIVGFFRDRK